MFCSIETIGQWFDIDGLEYTYTHQLCTDRNSFGGLRYIGGLIYKKRLVNWPELTDRYDLMYRSGRSEYRNYQVLD